MRALWLILGIAFIAVVVTTSTSNEERTRLRRLERIARPGMRAR